MCVCLSSRVPTKGRIDGEFRVESADVLSTCFAGCVIAPICSLLQDAKGNAVANIIKVITGSAIEAKFLLSKGVRMMSTNPPRPRT